MRFVGSAAAGAALLLAGCGDWKTGQANNAQGNISNKSRVPETANASAGAPANAMMLLAAAPPKDQALKIMHDRHEAMEGLGKAMKTLHRELNFGQARHQRHPRPDRDDGGRRRRKIPELVPGRNRPRRRQDRARSPKSGSSSELFVQRSKQFLAAAQAIDAAAKAGDVNKVMALHENVDKACKACHDPFRAPEH